MSKGEPEMAGLDILEPARLERERGRGETEMCAPDTPTPARETHWLTIGRAGETGSEERAEVTEVTREDWCLNELPESERRRGTLSCCSS
jgi:hypothetical protein